MIKEISVSGKENLATRNTILQRKINKTQDLRVRLCFAMGFEKIVHVKGADLSEDIKMINRVHFVMVMDK